jgi:L,D-peptidoglycan transpeptidase YkuD (ErfK/YbiS/YcfS/YnhG family)
VDILVSCGESPGSGVLSLGGARFRCALGRGGVRADKRDGDGATPCGCFPLRRVLYRADRLARPHTALAAAPIDPADRWCDDSADPRYNRQVQGPEGAGEALWREDGAYDVIVVLGYNDDPVVPGRGSAIFLHVARPGYAPTEGCVALALTDLLTVLDAAAPDTRIRVRPPPA